MRGRDLVRGRKMKARPRGEREWSWFWVLVQTLNSISGVSDNGRVLVQTRNI